MKLWKAYFFKNKVTKVTLKQKTFQVPSYQLLLKRFKDKYLTKILSLIITQERTL